VELVEAPLGGGVVTKMLELEPLVASGTGDEELPLVEELVEFVLEVALALLLPPAVAGDETAGLDDESDRLLLVENPGALTLTR
jgi:hypothetical protein